MVTSKLDRFTAGCLKNLATKVWKKCHFAIFVMTYDCYIEYDLLCGHKALFE